MEATLIIVRLQVLRIIVNAKPFEGTLKWHAYDERQSGHWFLVTEYWAPITGSVMINTHL